MSQRGTVYIWLTCGLICGDCLGMWEDSAYCGHHYYLESSSEPFKSGLIELRVSKQASSVDFSFLLIMDVMTSECFKLLLPWLPLETVITWNYEPRNPLSCLKFAFQNILSQQQKGNQNTIIKILNKMEGTCLNTAKIFIEVPQLT